MPPFPYRRINIVGAPGSGTSTLACALATEIGGRFIDADDFYWKPTDPPFRDKVDAPARLSALLSAMAGTAAGAEPESGAVPGSDAFAVEAADAVEPADADAVAGSDSGTDSSLASSPSSAPSPAIVAGSVCGWGAPLEDAFDLVVFLSLPTALRMQRIEARELARYGRADPAFMAWAAQYDEGVMPGRSRARHDAWLAERTCRVMRFDGDQAISDRVQAIVQAAARHAC